MLETLAIYMHAKETLKTSAGGNDFTVTLKTVRTNLPGDDNASRQGESGCNAK